MSRRPLWGLAVADAFSITGSRLSQIALPWYVLTSTGSAAWTGVAGFAVMLPYVVAKALGGPLVDRVGARRVAIAGDTVSAGVIALVPLLHVAGLLPLPVLLVLAAVMGALRGPSDGAKAALVPQVAADCAVPLERVTGLLGTIDRLGSTMGALLAGALVAWVGPVNAMALDALGVAVSAAVVAATVRPASRRGGAEEASSGYLEELRAGWRFLRTDTVLVGITGMVMVTNFLDQAFAAVLMPVWAKEHGVSIATVGVLFAVFGGTAVAGSAVATLLAERLPRLPVYAIAFFVCGVPRFGAMALGVSEAALFVVLAVGGFAAGFINPVVGAVIFERIPEALMGRVSALNTALCWGLIPFGSLAGGLLVARAGLAPTLWLFGAAYFLATLAPLVFRSFREFGVRPRPAETLAA